MSDSNIDITTHSCLTYLHHCPVCSNWRSIHHTQQSAMWALRPSSWIYTHSALVYTVIGPTPPEVFGVSRKLCSILATSQKHKINPRWLRYNMFIYSNSSMHPWHLWVLQQHLKVYRHMTCCRIPNIPFSLVFFFCSESISPPDKWEHISANVFVSCTNPWAVCTVESLMSVVLWSDSYMFEHSVQYKQMRLVVKLSEFVSCSTLWTDDSSKTPHEFWIRYFVSLLQIFWVMSGSQEGTHFVHFLFRLLGRGWPVSLVREEVWTFPFDCINALTPFFLWNLSAHIRAYI